MSDTRDGEVDQLTCGTGRDVAAVDQFDAATGCEHTTVQPVS